MIINFSDVVWARQAGFSFKVIRIALVDVHKGMGNFPDMLVYNQLILDCM
jgi:hypothetical protein